jgi:hypothetical protein
MPLRDHFRSPVNDRHRWDAVHGQWPAEIVRNLFDLLPQEFVAEPKVYHPAPFEVDVSTSELDNHSVLSSSGQSRGATAVMEAAAPTLSVAADLSELDEYEVKVYDFNRQRKLVAAIEIVSPANKDRPENRERFNNKVASLLRQDVCVCILDIVTIPDANLYVELLSRLGHQDPSISSPAPAIYAVTLRGRKPPKTKSRLDAWYFPLALGQPLPTIPLWLGPDSHIQLPLETSYQEVCRLLRIQ